MQAALGARDLAGDYGDEAGLAEWLAADQDRVVFGAQDAAVDDVRDLERRHARPRRQLAGELVERRTEPVRAYAVGADRVRRQRPHRAGRRLDHALLAFRIALDRLVVVRATGGDHREHATAVQFFGYSICPEGQQQEDRHLDEGI